MSAPTRRLTPRFNDAKDTRAGCGKQTIDCEVRRTAADAANACYIERHASRARRLEIEKMSDQLRNVVWIASYPKSGNTWLRFLTCNLLYGRQDSAAALNTLIPDVHEMGPELAGFSGAGFMKTHFEFSAQRPAFSRTAAAIYIVRNPADVLASNFHYSQRSAGNTDDSRDAFDQYFEAFIRHRGDPRWAQLGMGSWDGNVRSWLATPQAFPVVKIRYEDMSANPIHVAQMLATLLRPALTTEKIKEAVRDSSFERMREIEDADIREKRVGIFYKPYLQTSIDLGRRFMRRGAVGDGAGHLTADQQARLRAVFGPLMAELGY